MCMELELVASCSVMVLEPDKVSMMFSKMMIGHTQVYGAGAGGAAADHVCG